VRDLAGGEEVAILGHGEAGDAVRVALEEGLVLVVVHVPNDHRRAEGVDDVRVVRVEQESVLLHA